MLKDHTKIDKISSRIIKDKGRNIMEILLQRKKFTKKLKIFYISLGLHIENKHVLFIKKHYK